MYRFIIWLVALIILLSFGVAYAKKGLLVLKRFKREAVEDKRLKQKKIVHNGKKRAYLLFVPSDYSRGSSVSLVLVFHGGGGNARAMSKRVKMHEIAQREKFIVIYPNGASRTGLGKRGSWNAGSVPPRGYAEKKNIDDVGFVRALINRIQSEYEVDRNRIYACGLSKGGMLSYRLACEMSDVFAAIAVVAGVMTLKGCDPEHPVPLLAIHGSDDQNVPFMGGRGKHTGRRIVYRSVQESLEEWIRINHCGKKQTESSPARDTRCFHYNGCDAKADVVLCLIDNGGHGWPGTKPTRRQKKNNIYISPHYDASRAIWDFFAEHPK